MTRYRRSLLAGLASTGLLLGLFAGPTLAAPAAPAVHTYRVTITDLTGGQPLTPPVIATHRGDVNLFQLGQPASSGVQAVAENGNVPALVAQLESTAGVSSVVAAGAPLVPAGSTTGFAQSVTLTITAGPGAQFLSFESMLICTNDGFTGLNRIRLPNQVGVSATSYGDSYDAGTEINTEDLADIVPPCQGLIGIADDLGFPGTGMSNPALAEGGVVHHHLGIMGGADLIPAVHGWTDPTSMIEITRLS